MGRIKIDFGIDLGTTNSALAFVNNGEIEVKEIDRSRIVPSCVAYDRRGNSKAGISAQSSRPPIFSEFKRMMGTDWSDYKFPGLNERVTAEDLSAEMLKKLRSEITDEQFNSIVITVPAMFDINQVAATKRAGELAGFEQVEILMEPIAAAFAYGFKQKVQDGKYIVFDFGGGTFDAALVRSSGGVLSVVSSEGNNYLGGKDLDNAIVAEVLMPFIAQKYNIQGLDIASLEILKGELKKIADRLKIELTKSEEVDILTDLDQLGKDAGGVEIEIEKTFTRDEVYAVMNPIFMKAIGHTKNLISANALNIAEINALVLVGGPTQIPAFRELISKEIMVPDTSLNPMTAIAEGAALYASTFNSRSLDHGKPIRLDNELAGQGKEYVELEIEYAATSVNDEEPVGIKRKNSVKDFSVIVTRGTTWQSAKHTLDDVIMVSIDKEKPNSFTIQLFDERNNPVSASPSSFTIIPGISVDGGAPIPYHIGMEIFDDKRGNIFTPFKGLEKDKKLPLTGVTDRDLYTLTDLRPGIMEDKLAISVYLAEREAKNSRSIVNLYAHSIEVNGMDVSRLIPKRTRVEFTMRIDISQNMVLEIEFPDLDVEVITKSMQFPRKVGVSQKQIDNLLSEVEKSIARLEESAESTLSIGEFRSKQIYFKKQYQNVTNSDFEQIFVELRSFILELDKAEEEARWPVIKRKIIDSLFDFERVVDECTKEKKKGWEKDQSDLQYFKKQKDQLFSMVRPDVNLAEELVDAINGAIVSIAVRHEGREVFAELIESISEGFDECKWKDIREARRLVEEGKKMVRNGAGEEELRSQCRRIREQMAGGDLGAGGTGVGT